MNVDVLLVAGSTLFAAGSGLLLGLAYRGTGAPRDTSLSTQTSLRSNLTLNTQSEEPKSSSQPMVSGTLQARSQLPSDLKQSAFKRFLDSQAQSMSNDTLGRNASLEESGRLLKILLQELSTTMSPSQQSSLLNLLAHSTTWGQPSTPEHPSLASSYSPMDLSTLLKNLDVQGMRQHPEPPVL